MSGPTEAFVAEAREQVAELGDGLVAVEQSGGEGVEELFRVAHTLKGNCAAEGFGAASALAHAVEDLLDAVRAGEVRPEPALMDAAFEAVDALETTIEEIERTGEPATDPAPTVERLRTTIERHRDAGDDAGDAGETAETWAEELTWGEARPTDESSGSTAEAGSDGDNIDLDPEDAAVVENALRSASEFDDLDALTDEMGDEEAAAFADLEGAGTFDEATGDAADAPRAESGTDDGNDDAGFAALREDVEVADAGTMEAELEGVEFGDVRSEEQVSIEELLALEPDENEPVGESETASGTETATEDGPVDASETGEQQRVSGRPEEAAIGTDSTGREPTDGSDDAGLRDDIGGLIENIRSLDPDGDSTAATDDRPAGAAGADGPEQPKGDPDGTDLAEAGIEDSFETDAVFGETAETGEGLSLGDAAGDDEGSAVDRSVEAVMREAGPSATEVMAEADLEREGRTLEFASQFVEEFEDASDERERRPAPADATTTIPPSIPGGESDTDAAEESDDGRGRSINVDVEAADELLSLVERLVTNRGRLEAAYRAGSDEAVESALTELRSIVSRLEGTVRDVRLVELSAATAGLARTARDVARETGVEVVFQSDGEDVELDRQIVDALADPLVQLVRNAVDHGIEPPEEREAAGKDPRGRVELRAERVGDRVVVAVEDDGRGMDPDAIREQAVAEGLVTEAEALGMADREVFELVFRPGFSTREEVTSVSGRGVGLDVVHETVTELDGDVTVESEPDDGTTVLLTLPVAVALDEVLVLAVGGERFAVPADAVARVETATPDRIHGDYALGHPAAADGGDATEDDPENAGSDRYPLLQLADVLDVSDDLTDPDAAAPGGPTGPAAETSEPGVLVFVRDAMGPVALEADAIEGWKTVVVTPYDDLLGDVPGLAGAATLGDGSVANVLDVATLGEPSG